MTPGAIASERCEATRPAKAAGGKADGEKGTRCPNEATHLLMNGAQTNGRACEACARRLIADFEFLRMRPINC